MPGKSKYYGDVNDWLIKCINGCQTVEQLNSTNNILNNMLKLNNKGYIAIWSSLRRLVIKRRNELCKGNS